MGSSITLGHGWISLIAISGKLNATSAGRSAVLNEALHWISLTFIDVSCPSLNLWPVCLQVTHVEHAGAAKIQLRWAIGASSIQDMPWHRGKRGLGCVVVAPYACVRMHGHRDILHSRHALAQGKHGLGCVVVAPCACVRMHGHWRILHSRHALAQGKHGLGCVLWWLHTRVSGGMAIGPSSIQDMPWHRVSMGWGVWWWLSKMLARMHVLAPEHML
eukprot:1161528-Pelagomonas_calceolata.AAC.4